MENLTSSAIADRLYMEMCEHDDNEQNDDNKYFIRAVKYANRRAIVKQIEDFTDVYLVYTQNFSPQLKEQILNLRHHSESINEVITNAVFKIIKSRAKAKYYEYIQNEPLRWRLLDVDGKVIAEQSIPEGVHCTIAQAQEEPDDERKSPAQRLLEIVDKKSESLFQDQYGAPCIKVMVNDHSEIMFIANMKFKHYLSKVYFDDTCGDVVGQEVLNDAIHILTARALFEGPIMDLNLRVAWAKKNEEIHYDLTDSKWRCVRITRDGWSIIPHQTGTMFIRFNQKAQVEPDRNYPEDIFDQFLDLMHIYDHERRILNKVWIISAFIPEIPHPIDIAHGEKDSLKSTLCRYKKRLIDPDKIELLTIPKDKSEFVQQLYHNYLGVYENVRYIPSWFSDEACRAITGAGNSKRGLYTNDEDVIYNYKRCLMIIELI